MTVEAIARAIDDMLAEYVQIAGLRGGFPHRAAVALALELLPPGAAFVARGGYKSVIGIDGVVVKLAAESIIAYERALHASVTAAHPEASAWLAPLRAAGRYYVVQVRGETSPPPAPAVVARFRDYFGRRGVIDVRAGNICRLPGGRWALFDARLSGTQEHAGGAPRPRRKPAAAPAAPVAPGSGPGCPAKGPLRATGCPSGADRRSPEPPPCG